MKIYRVQDENGRGPYTSAPPDGPVREMFDLHNDNLDYWPPPEQDEGIDRFPGIMEKCGFANKEQLQRWFDKKTLDMLRQNGYNVVELKNVEITATGVCQVLWEPKNDR